ncbi:hypothetical protein GQ600_3089 [Phytophthora cactorum]|nr:hypothetical protein GQ600_3089 [Phytophthora cactorum]
MLAANVYAHGYMSDPAASASGLSGAFNGAPADDTAAFTTAFESSSYSSLKEFINEKATLTVFDATLTCARAIPMRRLSLFGTLRGQRVTFYWLALHSSTWQVYVTCEPLEGTTSTGTTSKYAVSGASSGTSTSTTTSMVSSAAGSKAASNSSSLESHSTTRVQLSSTSTETSTATTTTAPSASTTPTATTDATSTDTTNAQCASP